MEVNVVSREIVKPSSPTSKHDLKTYKLCSIDQSMPRVYIPVLLFYQKMPEEECNIYRLLKLSLSRLLTFFYPFAGTIITDDAMPIICDDRGVPFTLAKANHPLVSFLRQPGYGRLPGLLLEQLAKDPVAGYPHVAVVQLTHLSCGGFVLCAAVSHLVADASSVCFFLKTWAAMHRQSSSWPKPPIFNASALFPPAAIVPEEVGRRNSTMESIWGKQTKTVAKRRLVYGPTSVRALKEKAASPSVPNPTRAQVVSAHLVKSIIYASSKGRSENSTVIMNAVNLRRRAEPPLAEELIGNLLWSSVVPQVDVHEITVAYLVKQMQEALNKIDGGFVERMSSGGANTVFREVCNYCNVAPGSELIAISSWCNTGLYSVDFGWGKPIWVTHVGGLPITLMDTSTKDGVEALLTLDEALIAALERTPDLLAYATFDQTPETYQDNGDPIGSNSI